jgi:hypothetical protein
MVSAHFLYLGKVKFMEEGTPHPAYTFPSYTTYTPPHNLVITGTLIPMLQASFRDPKNFTNITRDVVVLEARVHTPSSLY